MNGKLAEMLGIAPDAGLAQLASALDAHRSGLEHQARKGDREACDRLLRLRLAYLNWAYASESHRSADNEESSC